jgi:SPX domain protein involved in polyphosphate accumulation
MKYGEYLEAASVPRWSLQNIDYNSLKQLIKLHTTKGQARAMAIPGQTNHALERFENDFYNELHLQHQRVDLFVASKADEISRRLAHLAGLINALIVRCSIGKSGVTDKRQRKFVKYQRQVIECGYDIRDLQRFVHAQNEAFRKILKKYKVRNYPTRYAVLNHKDIHADLLCPTLEMDRFYDSYEQIQR